MEEKKLRRPRSGRMLAGVYAAFARFFGIGVTWVRLVYAFLTVFTAFAGVFVYLLMIPKENN